VQGFSLQECLDADIYFADSFPQAFYTSGRRPAHHSTWSGRSIAKIRLDSRPGVA
jgi:hypothetical protein